MWDEQLDTSTSWLLLSENIRFQPISITIFILYCVQIHKDFNNSRVTLNATWKAREHDVLFSPAHLMLFLQVNRIAYTESEQVC